MNELAGRIQESELEIMRLLWEAGGTMPLAEMRERLHGSCGWEYSTVKTLLKRLVDKGAAIPVSRGGYTVRCSHSRNTTIGWHSA